MAGGGGVVERLEGEVVGRAQVAAADLEDGVEGAVVERGAAGLRERGDVLLEILTGLQSAFTYTGATRCEQFLAQSVVGVQTAGGYHEGTPHGGRPDPTLAGPSMSRSRVISRSTHHRSRLTVSSAQSQALRLTAVWSCTTLRSSRSGTTIRRTSFTGPNDG